MRSAFEAWAQKDGHIVRRREDKPEEYLVYETQRRWLIWQAALEHGKTPGGRKAPKEAVDKGSARTATATATATRPQVIASDEAAVRNQVLNEVLDAFSALKSKDNTAMDDIMHVIQGLKQKEQAAKNGD
jgi:ABC-type glutathione transport system ATPase component